MTATVALPESRNLLTTEFNPNVLVTMSNSELLDLIDLGIHGQANVSNLIAHSVVTMIERGAYDLVKARFGGSDGEDEPTFLVTREARQLLAPRVIKKGWTQQQVADLFGTSQRTIGNDVSNFANEHPNALPSTRVDSKGRVQPTAKKPRQPKPAADEPVDAEIVEDPDANKKFRCTACGKQKPFGTRQELEDGKLYCEPCADDYDNSKPEPAEPTTRLVKSTTKTRKLADLQREVWNTAASMPWTQQQLQFINDTLDKINELMEEE